MFQPCVLVAAGHSGKEVQKQGPKDTTTQGVKDEKRTAQQRGDQKEHSLKPQRKTYMNQKDGSAGSVSHAEVSRFANMDGIAASVNNAEGSRSVNMDIRICSTCKQCGGSLASFAGAHTNGTDSTAIIVEQNISNHMYPLFRLKNASRYMAISCFTVRTHLSKSPAAW